MKGKGKRARTGLWVTRRSIASMDGRRRVVKVFKAVTREIERPGGGGPLRMNATIRTAPPHQFVTGALCQEQPKTIGAACSEGRSRFSPHLNRMNLPGNIISHRGQQPSRSPPLR